MAALARLLLLLLLASIWSSGDAIYCGDDDCYDILGVTQEASSADIKKAYYKLSLEYHPDKNPDPEAKKVFVKVATAYEILKDDVKREQYDYAVAHPEEVLYNTARYYQAYYGPKADLRAVFVGLLLVFSLFQYGVQWTSYRQAMDLVKQTPAYKNKLRAFELEKSGHGASNKKKSSKEKRDGTDEKEFVDSLDFQIQGVERPDIWSLVGMRVLLLPYTLGKLAYWQLGWSWRYRYKKQPLSFVDAEYLTRRALGMNQEAWSSMGTEVREELVARELWHPNNLEAYKMETRKRDSKRRR